ncbi:unnamed protein product [Gulo gulo]|uniref:Uncharacterized protein n=1 Tax=Gulo gulo TaxID=48420 RepID=A0A9X9LJ08_GULGU|nr:unnamed protein product [Gulo gulo]
MAIPLSPMKNPLLTSEFGRNEAHVFISANPSALPYLGHQRKRRTWEKSGFYIVSIIHPHV